MDDGLEGFGVGGAAEDDKAGQPVAVGVLGGGDEPGQPYPHPGQRLAGVADRAGDELGHRHRDRARTGAANGGYWSSPPPGTTDRLDTA